MTSISNRALIEAKLRSWHRAEEKRKQLEISVSRQEARLNDLRDKLSASSILGSLNQKYDVMDMPRGSGVTDTVGNLVIQTVSRTEELEEKLNLTRAELVHYYGLIQEIEDMIAPLAERYKRLLSLYYRDQMPWQQICAMIYISKPRLYQMIDEALTNLDIWF